MSGTVQPGLTWDTAKRETLMDFWMKETAELAINRGVALGEIREASGEVWRHFYLMETYELALIGRLRSYNYWEHYEVENNSNFLRFGGRIALWDPRTRERICFCERRECQIDHCQQIPMVNGLPQFPEEDRTVRDGGGGGEDRGGYYTYRVEGGPSSEQK